MMSLPTARPPVGYTFKLELSLDAITHTRANDELAMGRLGSSVDSSRSFSYMSSPIPKNSFKSGLSEWGKRTMSAAVGLRLGLFVVLGGCACLGCESAHYVVRGPDRGVVAIP